MNDSKPNKSKHKNKVDNSKKPSQSESKDKYGFISKTKKKETFRQCSILNYVVSQKRETQAETEKEKETKKEESVENKKEEQKSKNKSKNRSKSNDRSKSKGNGVIYVKKIVSKSKSKIINSKLSKRNTINNINRINTINKSNDEISSKESLNNSNDKIIIDNKDKDKNNDDVNGEKMDNNLSQIANKNFNETLFDYKKYNLMHNPRKRKQEFDYELKETKKLKDISMKKKKKGWIKKTFVEKVRKEKENEKEEKNDNKIILQNKKNKNKKNVNSLNVINEEESTKKSEAKNNYFSDNKKEEEKEKENENENDYSELNMFNKMFKRSQDDFGIDLLSTSNVMNERNNIINDNETDNIISKYSDIKLKRRNANIEKDINYQKWEKNNNNDDENEIKLDEDINVNNKTHKNK